MGHLMNYSETKQCNGCGKTVQPEEIEKDLCLFCEMERIDVLWDGQLNREIAANCSHS
jgi:hypothetical protein